MRKIIEKQLTKVIKLYSQHSLPSLTQEYFMTPLPPYYSQFVDIYPATLTPETQLTNQKHINAFGARDSQAFTFWAWRNCGIACVKMILESKGKAQNKTIMNLTQEGIKLGGYILYENNKFVDKGWFHAGLVVLLKKYGVSAHTKKWQSIESVAVDIYKNHLTILSIKIPGRRYIQEDGSFKPKKGATYMGHLVLATGVKIKNKIVEGIYVHDPRGLKNYQANTFIPKDVFETIFTGRTIVTC